MNKIIYTILTAALIVMVIGTFIIPILRVLKLGQYVRDEGPRTHLKKSGTPTMGGLMILISLIITNFVFNGNFDGKYAVTMIITIGCGCIGLLDDSIKILQKNSQGLRAYQKLIGQFIFAIILSYYAYKNVGSRLYIPFTGTDVDFGVYYIPLVTLSIVFIINSVNFTDGLDGLASSVTLIAGLFFIFVCFGINMDGLAIYSAAIVGACLGFLYYNSYTAKVIMGDTGSQALGGAVAALTVLTGLTLYLPIFGIIYVAEGVSVILQVGIFKLTGKRLFKMTPIHHHYEISGLHETKIVALFGIITVLFCLLAFLAL